MASPRDPTGELPRACVNVLVAASVITMALAYLGGHNIAWFLAVDSFWLRNGLAIWIAVWIAFAWLPSWRTARALRVAVVLPAILVATIIVGWMIWTRLAPGDPTIHLSDEAPLAHDLPLASVAVLAGALTLLVARAITWRRRREWLHACVMLSLTHLLVAGVVTAMAPASADGWALSASELRQMLEHWPIVLGVSFGIATVFTVVAIHWFERVLDWRDVLIGMLVIALLLAAMMRAGARGSSPQIYANYFHVLFALALVAAASLAVLGLATWLADGRSRRMLARSPLAGTIASDGDEAVVSLQIAGWLRGPRVVMRPFEVTTAAGTIRVPVDAAIAASPLATSTRLRSGEHVDLLRPGDRVWVAGFVEPPRDHPFRSAVGLVPGPDGIAIGREGEPPAGFAGVALALWRPCITYLLVVTAAALPALAAALAAVK